MEIENNANEKSVGRLLKETRLAKGLTLEDVEKATHIYIKNLTHLENDEFDKTPGEFFVKGALRNYGNFLGLNGPELVDMYKASVAGKALHEVEAHGIREAKNVTMNIQFKDKRDIGSGSGSFDLKEKFNVELPWKQIGMGVAALAVMGMLYYAIPAVINWSSNVSLTTSSTEKPKITPATIDNKKDEKPVADKLVLELEATDKCWLEVYGDDKQLAETMIYAGYKKTYEAKDKLVVKYGNVGAVKITLNGEVQNVDGEKGVANKVYMRERPTEPAKPEEQQKEEAPVVKEQAAPNAPVAQESAANEAAKEEPAKVEAPKAEEPAKVEEPKAEAPKAEEPAMVEAPAKVEAPQEAAPKPSKKDKKK